MAKARRPCPDHPVMLHDCDQCVAWAISNLGGREKRQVWVTQEMTRDPVRGERIAKMARKFYEDRA